MRLPTYKSLVPEQALVKWDSSHYAFDYELIKRSLHTRNGSLTRIRPDDQFGQ